ncbi:hypothetical protein ELBI_64 [Anabaena phage Elbi]|nr:hypothetical protein ELBI_64 [Anabaena phage Elbi]
MKVIYNETSSVYIIYGTYESLSRLGGTLERMNLKPDWFDSETMTVNTESDLKPFLSAYCGLLNINLEFYYA